MDLYFLSKLIQELSQDLRCMYNLDIKVEKTKHGFCILVKPRKLKKYITIFGLVNNESFYFLLNYNENFKMFKELIEKNYKDNWGI